MVGDRIETWLVIGLIDGWRLNRDMVENEIGIWLAMRFIYGC